MNELIFKDFILNNKVDKSIFDKYNSLIPGELYEIWIKYGFGSFMNGYLKVINPDKYIDILKESYFRADVSIPVFATSMADLITFEKDKYIGIVRYRRGTFDILPTNMKRLISSNLLDDYFINKHMDCKQYDEAVKRIGIPEYDECFGYVPLLGLGGPEKVENLKKCKLYEHICIINSLIGPIGFD